jgi:Flp pilus assembly protein TadG
VDFVLVSVLLVILVLGVLQVAFALHVRNTVTAAAAEGARYAANADRGPQDGADRTRAVIAESVGGRFAQDVDAGVETIDGVDVVVVQVRTRLPVLGPLGPARSLVVRGHAFLEVQR